jgi:hypothetical protein
MLAKLFRAEVYKIIGNRWTTGFLVWIFPVGALGFLIVFNLILLISSGLRDAVVDDGPQQWTSAMIGVWSFANNPLGRLFFLGFAAVLLAASINGIRGRMSCREAGACPCCSSSLRAWRPLWSSPLR